MYEISCLLVIYIRFSFPLEIKRYYVTQDYKSKTDGLCRHVCVVVVLLCGRGCVSVWNRDISKCEGIT